MTGIRVCPSRSPTSAGSFTGKGNSGWSVTVPREWAAPSRSVVASGPDPVAHLHQRQSVCRRVREPWVGNSRRAMAGPRAPIAEIGLRSTDVRNARSWSRSASDAKLPAELMTVLLPDATVDGGIGRLERLASREPVTAYRFLREGQEHHVFFSAGGGRVDPGNWTSDAKFLYWALDRATGHDMLVMCGGTYADVRGAACSLERPARVDYAEVFSSAGAEVSSFSSDPRRSFNGSLDRVEAEFAVPGNVQTDRPVDHVRNLRNFPYRSTRRVERTPGGDEPAHRAPRPRRRGLLRRRRMSAWPCGG